ncbi:hypothetical protein M3204_16820 [Mesobacillus subterraneus]|uniref:hypothetical protein n=1 Tax=Mesobacillus subterraneus TaxID=285983 RepID=UPI00203C1C94|nr:hypothetical protein [Mesobacillus subterraneus]MCM3666083.1 hypothetical protein [Mesobacillus subterraneus]MCM3685081.1 hypothetical protein [Mesobacillus subterraneus]
MGFDESKMENRAPAEVEGFAEENYRSFILDIVSDSNAAAFNFTKGDQDLKLGRLIPENRLVIDKHLNITVEAPAHWVAPVYQSGELKNAFDIYNPSKGKIAIAGISYSGGFTREIAYLEEEEFYLHSRPFEFDFAYSPSKNKVRPLGDSSIRQFEEIGLDPNGITKTEFIAFVKQHLKNNYPDQFNEEGVNRYPYILGGIALLILILGFLLLRRQKRSMNG